MSAWGSFPIYYHGHETGLLLFTFDPRGSWRLESILHVALHYNKIFPLFSIGGRGSKLGHTQIKCLQESLELWVWWEKGRAWIMSMMKEGRGIVPSLSGPWGIYEGGSTMTKVVTRWEGTFGKVSYTREGALYREAVRVSDEGGVVQAWVVSCPSSVPQMNDTSENGMTKYIQECIYNNPSPKGGICLCIILSHSCGV